MRWGLVDYRYIKMLNKVRGVAMDDWIDMDIGQVLSR